MTYTEDDPDWAAVVTPRTPTTAAGRAEPWAVTDEMNRRALRTHSTDEIDTYLDSISVMTAGRLREKWPASVRVIEAEARAEPRAEGLDVERLARALEGADYGEMYVNWTSDVRDVAAAIAREYAALEEPTP